MSNKEKIIFLIRQKGPCLPSDVYRELETNQLFASAMLGELVSTGVLKVTNLKRSSSPYYYLSEQKEKLQDLSQFLNDKDKMAYDLLKQKLILKDIEQSPLMRVALRAIKDYAFPIQIRYNDQILSFWKWYLLSNKEAEEKIKDILGITKPEPKKQEVQKTIPIKKIEKEKPKQIPKTHKETSTQFLEKLRHYFSKNNITIIEQTPANKKNTEIDFILELPSAVGKLQYYCKAKSKKKINDADIASAMIQGQQKNLPVLVLIIGDMTKKSQEMLNKEFKGVKVQKI